MENTNNWFKIIIAISILIIACSVGYYFVNLSKQKNNLELQAQCSNLALKYFNEQGYKVNNADGDTYTNHYNLKLNKCFILLSHYKINEDSLMIDLVDALESKVYADFYGHNTCDPMVLTTTNQKTNKCQFDQGNIWFDGDSTRNPSDYQIGFNGLINGGIGDQNTQKKFLEHIKPFMEN